MASTTSVKIDSHPVNALADVPDFRDLRYRPTLTTLAHEQDPPQDLLILDQGKEGACTGFGLAAVINKRNQDRHSPVRVSPRMLYEMAKRFDVWPGQAYEGSSCRGAIKGWYQMGVCGEKAWPYKTGKPGSYTMPRAIDARSNTIGAYYRVDKDIVAMHAALNEAGALFVSADVHSGWSNSAITESGEIPMQEESEGGHAFSVVGYNARGFWVQNSWGRSWGLDGLALWTYEDWKANVHDAWVVSLGLPTPQLWEAGEGGQGTVENHQSHWGGSRPPRRSVIAGHFVHIDDGRFKDSGRYWSDLPDVRATADHVAASDNYDHLLFYAHGGLNSPKASASRIAAMRDTYKANRIYPYHFMYDTGLLEEIKDVVFRKRSSAQERAGGFSDWWDRTFESITRVPGRALWREMKSGASSAFRTASAPGSQGLGAFLKALSRPGAKPKKIHLVGHSTGAILLAHLLRALARQKTRARISSVSLLAPAASVGMFESHYVPLLKASAGKSGIDQMRVYNLADQLERDDNVALVYRKSLLYLVSNAFEERRGEAILGLQKFSQGLPVNQRLKIEYSGQSSGRATTSRTHGGFDNDPATMNSVLRTILGKKPQIPFTTASLDY